jgi:hypothetical protein
VAPEVVAFFLGTAALAVAAVMAIVGLLALTGGLRITSCRRCAKWTVMKTDVQSTRQCLRCRHPLPIHLGHANGVSRLHRPAAR